MDQIDSLNEIIPSSLPNTSMTAVAEANASSVMGIAVDQPPFQYLVNEQAKSILALQELQNEVKALLEFRDLVMEVFPQLGQKMQTFNNALPLPNPLSPSKWVPGVRVKRKLGQQLRDQEILVPSLLPRSRSYSHGKASRSSEMSGSATSSSAIQDSGFCTESSKDHSSAISTRSKSCETDDDLFNILDDIHHKGTRLKLEVEYLWSMLNRKGNLSLGTKRRCKSLDDLILTNTHSFTFECAVKTAFLETELGGLKRERDMLLKKMTEIESEHMTNLAQTNRLLLELETISAEKRDLENRLQMAIHSENEITNRISDLQHKFLTRNQQRNVQTPFAKCQLLKLMQVFEGTNRSVKDAVDHTISPLAASSTLGDSYFNPSERLQESKNLSYDIEDAKIDRPVNPVTKELNANSYQAESQKHKIKNKDHESHIEVTSTTASVVTLASTKDFNDMADNKADYSANCGKPDVLIGFLSGHPLSMEPSRRDGGITLSKERVLSILNECNVKELHRFLLTLSYQVEALNMQIQWISQSRLNVFQQLSRYKSENEELKFQLEEKNIQLEGTKAKVRVLERMRNEKFSYSTSDLMTDIPKSSQDIKIDSVFTSPVSDTGVTSKQITMPLTSKNNTKCMDLRDPSNKLTKSGACRRSISKIPLKTCSSSKLPTKLNSNSKKTFTSFKEYPAPGLAPHSSCISSMSSSLNNK